MSFTALCIVVMLLLLKFSSIDKWWLSFWILLSVAALLGYELRMFGFVIAIGVWRVFKDLCQAGRSN